MSASPSAEDHSKLLRDYADATEQFRATNEVLTALGRSTSDPDARSTPSSKALGGSAGGRRDLPDRRWHLPAGVLRRSVGGVRPQRDRLPDGGEPWHGNRTGGWNAGSRRSATCSPPEFARRRAADGRHPSSMSAPLLLDGEVVGGLSCTALVDPFDDREEALLEAFAAQAAVVHNVHLVRALEERGAELVRRVEQMQALSDVGQMVGSSLVLDEVLSNIIKNAVRFSGCDGGSVMEYVEEERCFTVRSAYASSPELLATAHYPDRTG